MATILQTTFFKWIFLNENYHSLIKISLKSAPLDPIRNKSLLFLVMIKLLPESILTILTCYVNSSPPSSVYKRQWIESALVQIMACRIFGTKPLSKAMLTYCQLDSNEQTSMKVEARYKPFHSRKCMIWKHRLQNGGHFVQGGDKLTLSYDALWYHYMP